MASYYKFLQPANQRFESPAKVFARLKSKVQREAMLAKEGVCLDKGSPYNDRKTHEADVNSPRKRTESIWTNDDCSENLKCGSYRVEVQAPTISPISSPQKIFGHSFFDTESRHVDRMHAEPEHRVLTRHGGGLTNRTVFESTAVSALGSLGNREQILPEPACTRDFNGCEIHRTPVKIKDGDKKSVFGVKNDLMSPSKIYSPMKTRLRKRKWDQDLSKVNSSSQVETQTRQRIISPVLSEDDVHNSPSVEDLCGVTGVAAEQSEMSQFPLPQLTSPARSIIHKRCSVTMERFPQMSPARIFAYMKEREKKRAQACDVNIRTRGPVCRGDLFQSQDKPSSTAQDIPEAVDTNFRNIPEAAFPVRCSRVETAVSQSHLTEDPVVRAVQPQAALLEDPLVLNSPRVSIPKKQRAVFPQIRMPPPEKIPNEDVIHLKQWFLRKTSNGLFVDGIRREQNIPWNSNIIEDRVSDTVLKTVSGRVYILIGKMKPNATSGFPKWFLKKFVNGFPPNWKALYEKFLSESRDSDPNKETKTSSKRRNGRPKKESEVSSISVSVQRHRPNAFNTPASSQLDSTSKVSRSGRTIKAPLEYWKGGRVTLDSEMNVTIHECYDTTICNPEVTTVVTARKSQKPTRVFQSCTEGQKQRESPSEEEEIVPVRKVKTSRRIRIKAKTDPQQTQCNPLEHTVDTFSSPEELPGHTRSRQRCSARERMEHLDTIPQRQREPEITSTRRSKKRMQDTNRPSVRGRKKAVASSPEPLSRDDETSQQSSDDIFSNKRTTQHKRDNRKRRERLPKEPQQDHTSTFSESSQISDENEEKRRKRTRVKPTNDAARTQRKYNKVSPPEQPKSSQSSRKHKANNGQAVVPQVEDEDEWTEAELMKLQEAMAYYPKHVTGYWAKVAKMVGTRSPAECHHQHTFQRTSQTPDKKAKKPRKEKLEGPKVPATDFPVISARAGTFKRKQQVRQFLEAMPREDVDDIFSSAYMQNKRFQIPSMCPSDDHDFAISDLEPLTPTSKVFPDVKTPQCLHITPGMMGSPNSNNNDKYVYQLQKRLKNNRFNVRQPAASKRFTPTPSVKRTMRRCGTTENDNFVVWEMFPGNEGALSESEEEEDFYFSDND